MLSETHARLAELVREHVHAESGAPGETHIHAGNASPVLVGSNNQVTINVTCPLTLELLRLLTSEPTSA